MTTEANIYPTSTQNPTITHSDTSRDNLGLCFSGGGSRALTCAWGQLLGMKTLNLENAPRYISSVSGGTWASSIYTFLPDNISDDELLGTYYKPSDLSLTGDNNSFDVNNLGEYSLGKAPAGLVLGELAISVGLFYALYEESDYKWLWASIVAEYVLDPFNLRAEGSEIWISDNYYSLSLSYTQKAFPDNAPSTNDFFYVRPERPFLIMNDNIIELIASNGNVVQLPNQATPVSTGAQGQTPAQGVIGGGSVETYGYNSTLEQSAANSSPVDIKISQSYSLIDSVSTSSAFFAESLVRYFDDEISDDKKRSVLAQNILDKITEHQKKNLLGRIDVSIEEHIENSLLKVMDKKDFDPAEFVPTYNYWTIAQSSENTTTQYTDGGTLDNTGVVGMLTQTDTGSSSADEIYLAVFDNTSTPLEKKDGKIIAGGQAAALFGIDFDEDSGAYQAFTSDQKDPENSAFEATSLIQVFDNSADSSGKTPFDNLVNGLYAANCGAPLGTLPNDSLVNTAPAFYSMSLTTVDNPLANITGGRSVKVLYIQNAKILNWQNDIGDSDLKDDIVKGQASDNPFEDFAGFPNYSTFFKIGLEAKESNVLSQMSAWALVDDNSPLTPVFSAFISSASH